MRNISYIRGNGKLQNVLVKKSPVYPIRVLLMMDASFAFSPKRIWSNDSGIDSLCDGWEIELSKIIGFHLICHLYFRMQNVLAAKTIKRMRKRTL